MYESEVNSPRALDEAVSESVLTDLVDYRSQITARTVLPWGEHCTECVWPSCYASCELYERRTDGGCRQFVGGVGRVPTPGASVPYLQRITFRRWGKLWSRGSTVLQPLDRADRWERINVALGAAAQYVAAPDALKRRLLGKLDHLRRNKLAHGFTASQEPPDCFVAEILNPSQTIVTLTLSIKGHSQGSPRPFQKLLTIDHGLHRERIGFDEIAALLQDSEAFDVEIVPNNAENVTLLFGLIDFVKERGHTGGSEHTQAASKCKCVVWDLDNTLWHGTLIEDGLDGLTLREGVKQVIQALDEKGILQSIVSKNRAEDAMVAVRKFGLEDYFLFPRIGWGPKSEAIAAIARTLNIDESTFVFIDDQPFERQEVSSALPSVTALDVDAIPSLLDRPSFDVPVTDESRRRRLMYREQATRLATQASYGGDYLRFLRDNDMKVFVAKLVESNLNRVYELAQRTNQMNFSGNRYSFDELTQLSTRATCEAFVIRCVDRFGDYGIVGFAVTDVLDRRLLDLMFSCRVQAKRVEHGFLAWLIGRFRERDQVDVFANYRKTAKNDASGAVFSELGFVEQGSSNGVTDLRFDAEKSTPNVGVVSVISE
jgi:FkbH-like protein